MSQRYYTIAVIASISMILIGFIFVKSINRRNMLIKNSQDNWKWDDNWSTKKNILKKEIKPTPKKTEPIEKKQITAVNFKAAI